MTTRCVPAVCRALCETGTMPFLSNLPILLETGLTHMHTDLQVNRTQRGHKIYLSKVTQLVSERERLEPR